MRGKSKAADKSVRPTRETIPLAFASTKELIWAVRNGNFSSGLAFVYYTGDSVWSTTDAATVIINESISIGVNPTSSMQNCDPWCEINPNSFQTVGTFNVYNNTSDKPIYFNPTSLSIGTYGITNQIFADVIVNSDSTITINNVVTTLTVRDLSIPVQYMTDTRFNACDPIVHIFSNYGLLIDGTGNPVEYGLLQFNGQDRFDMREGVYFNIVQPEQHHTITPKDGVNCYSFALYPEQHQPSGTSNLSRITQTTLILTFNDITASSGLPSLEYFNGNNQLYIFAF